jgi:hypothetical protein
MLLSARISLALLGVTLLSVLLIGVREPGLQVAM